MPFRVPEQLESDRLLLRQFTESDWRGLHEWPRSEARMPFEVHLMTFHESDVAPTDTGLVRPVLADLGITQCLDPEYVQLTDGLEVEIWGGGIFEAASIETLLIATRGMSGSFSELVFNLMDKARMTALVVDEPLVPLVRDPEMATHLPYTYNDDWPEARVCVAAVDVAGVVESVFKKWYDWASPIIQQAPMERR